MAEVTFTVSQIHCDGYKTRIQTGLGRLERVRRVRTDQETQTVTVRYNEQTVGEDRLVEQLEQLGYHVRPAATEQPVPSGDDGPACLPRWRNER